MNYKIEVEPVARPTTLADLKDGSLAIVLEGEFKGELFFKNVAGLHSISKNRYWESEYISQERLNRAQARYHYTGPLETACRPIAPGDVLTIVKEK